MKVKPSVKKICEKCKTIRRHGPLGPFTAEERATLLGAAFFGSEALLLLGFERDALPIRSALRRIGVVIRALEEGAGTPIVAG
jgi:hypothetical protein